MKHMFEVVSCSLGQLASTVGLDVSREEAMAIFYEYLAENPDESLLLQEGDENDEYWKNLVQHFRSRNTPGKQ